MKTFCLSFIFIFSISLSAQDTFNKRITLGYHYTNFTGIAINDTSIFCAGIYVDTIPPYPEGSFLYEMNLDGNVTKEFSLSDSIGRKHVWRPFLNWKNDTILFNLGEYWVTGNGSKGIVFEYDIKNGIVNRESFIGNASTGIEPNGMVKGFDEKLKLATINGPYLCSFAAIDENYNIEKLEYLNENILEFVSPRSLAKGKDKYFIGLVKSNVQLIDYEYSNIIMVFDSTDKKIFEYETPDDELWYSPRWIETTSDDGILVAANKCEEVNFGSPDISALYMQPAVYKLKFFPTINRYYKVWEQTFESGSAHIFHGLNKILPVSPDKKEFVAIGQHRTEPYVLKGFMVKFTEDGDSLWRRDYEYLTEGKREHHINDIIPAKDGGFYLCGLVSDNQDTLASPFRRGWLMKVDEHGCLIPGCEQTSATEDFKEEVSVLLYPNPTTEFLNFQIQNLNPQKKLTCRILDNQGKVVKNLKEVNGGTTYFTPVHDLANGIYFLQIFEGNSLLHSAKFLKQ